MASASTLAPGWRSSGSASPGCSPQRTSGQECAASLRTDQGKRASVVGEGRALPGPFSLTSSAGVKGGDFSRSRVGLRCWFAVHRRALLRKKAPRAGTACPAAVLPADGLAIAADSMTGSRPTDKMEGRKRASAPPPAPGALHGHLYANE